MSDKLITNNGPGMKIEPFTEKDNGHAFVAMPTSSADLKGLPEDTGEIVMANATTKIFIKSEAN